jgi:hypothetical protein
METSKTPTPHLLERTIRCATLTILFFGAFAVGSWAQEESDILDPNNDQIKSWIRDLSSETYAARDYANRRVKRHLVRALPILIEMAGSATESNAESILQFIGLVASNATSDHGADAFACLERLAEDRMTYRAVVAQRILEGVTLEMRDTAVELLSKQGVTLRGRTLPVLTRSREVLNPLVIDSNFTGTEQDLKLLKWLFDVQFVKLEGPRITKGILQQVVQLPKIDSLQIVNTSLTGSDLECLLQAPDLKLLEILYTPIDDSSIELLEQLPVYGDMQFFGTDLSVAGGKDLIARVESSEVFVGRGGFLGIECEQSSLIIRRLIPEGAAERAGMRQEDKIVKIDGVNISNFDELRRELSKFADGEKVVVDVERQVHSLPRNGDFRKNRDLLFEYAPLQFVVTLQRRSSDAR